MTNIMLSALIFGLGYVTALYNLSFLLLLLLNKHHKLFRTLPSFQINEWRISSYTNNTSRKQVHTDPIRIQLKAVGLTHFDPTRIPSNLSTLPGCNTTRPTNLHDDESIGGCHSLLTVEGAQPPSLRPVVVDLQHAQDVVPEEGQLVRLFGDVVELRCRSKQRLFLCSVDEKQ